MARVMKDSGIEWIGEIPAEWLLKKIKQSFTVFAGATPKSEKPEYWNGDISWITPADYKTEEKYVYTGKKNISMEGYKSCGTTIVPKGSVIFSKRAPVGTVAICGNELCTNQGCLACVPFEMVDGIYYYYTISIFTEQFELVSSGTTFKEISANSFVNFPLPYPIYEEQIKISSFLDKKCAELSNVIEKTRASIEEYKNLKQAVTTQAVTKGIRGDREMKNSRIEWIGEIPNGWEERRIKTLFNLREEKNYSPLEEVNLISLYTDLGVIQHSELEKTTGNRASNADGYKMVYKDDIVVNIILCWMGAIGRSEYDGVTSPAYDIYIPQNKVLSKFYHYYFRTKGFSGDCYKRGRGIMAMRWRTYSDQFRDIRVVYPPLKEQQEIVNYLDQKCSAIDELIAKKEQYLSEIENYKKSLIYEYVTGKKEVPQKQQA